MSTIGQMVLVARQSMTEISIDVDGGSYEGCKAEYDVRKLSTVEALPGLGIANPIVSAIMDGASYGMGWGDTSGLYPVSAEQIEQLRAESARVTAIAAERRAKDAAIMAEMDKADARLCQHCGSHCYGDCQAA